MLLPALVRPNLSIERRPTAGFAARWPPLMSNVIFKNLPRSASRFS